MNYIESVEIEGFWGTKKVSLKLHDDLNFLIGPNGSGKTTIINLISAVLRADIPALYAVQFKKVTVRLKAIESTRKPVIEVAKVVDKKMGSFELQYTVREKSSDKGSTYGVEGPYDERIYRDLRYARLRRHMEVETRLSHILSDIVEVNWLSIHRTTADVERRNKRADSYESSVDEKLHDISRTFSNYFSLLTSKAEKENKNFQEYVFLALLDSKGSPDDFFNEAGLNLKNKNEDTVIGFLKDLGVASTNAENSVNAHNKRVSGAQKRWQDNKSRELKDAITLSNAARVREMISEWYMLKKKREKIYQPRVQFEEIINSLFSNKELHFDERNKPMVHLKSDKLVSIDVLSSGEKQLFILLGEALLQEDRPVVFISDEPELSLHVSWQGSLFENIRNLNGSCQILSATHSPDIVGAFQDRVIHIEGCISDVH